MVTSSGTVKAAIVSIHFDDPQNGVLVTESGSALRHLRRRLDLDQPVVVASPFATFLIEQDKAAASRRRLFVRSGARRTQNKCCKLRLVARSLDMAAKSER